MDTIMNKTESYDLTLEERKNLETQMYDLLERFDYDITQYGVSCVVEEWQRMNAWLIRLLQNSPYYVDGKFYIRIPGAKLRRPVDTDAVWEYSMWCKTQVGNNLPLFDIFENIPETQFTSAEDSEMLNELLSSADIVTRAHKGEKVTKLYGRICKELGLDKVVDMQTTTWITPDGTVHEREKDMGYNHYRALLGDALNPIEYERDVYISVNPVDFLTMSFGYRWASCHTIDKRNRRHCDKSYEGMYSGGTMSYMLDNSSMIVYIACTEDELEAEGELDLPTEERSKWKRSVIHLGEDKLIMERVYPDGRDGGDKGISAQLRAIVQKTIADCLGADNMWSLVKGTNRASEMIAEGSGWSHYPDYEHNGDTATCFLRRRNGDINDRQIIVGAYSVCPCCGEQHHRNDNIVCDDCHKEYDFRCNLCGDGIYEDDPDAIFVDGYIYCCTSCAEVDGYIYTEDGVWMDRNEAYQDYYDDSYWSTDELYDSVRTADGNWYSSSENAELDGYMFCEDRMWHHDWFEDANTGETYSKSLHPEYVEIDDLFFVNPESAEEYGYRLDGDGEWVKAKEGVA